MIVSMWMMLFVVACYTVCSLSDKTAVAKLRFAGGEFAFLMAACTSFFMLFTLPFVDTSVTLCPYSLIYIVLVCSSKMLEFLMSAIILRDMSAFELKAWLGITLFMSYFTDAFMYESGIKFLCIVFICVTVAGLFMIAHSGGKSVDYKRIALPLVVYLAAKFGYGFVIKAAAPYISSTMCLFFALLLMALILLPKAHLIRNIKEKPKGTAFVGLTKIPNVAGLLGENAVIAVSLTDYSFIQPMILCVLFFIEIFTGGIKKIKKAGLNFIGSVVCIAGIVGFQLADVFLQ